MRMHLLAIGRRMPGWVDAGFDDYAKRLQGEVSLQLQALNAAKRGANPDLKRLLRSEGEAMLAAMPARAHVVALDVRGQSWSTPQLAERLQAWMLQARDVALLIGGADGLDSSCLEAAHERWSLSPLTFPHALVRVMVAEQLYRAWSLLRNHPYHRE